MLELSVPAAARSVRAVRGFEVLAVAALGALQTLACVITSAWWLPMLCIAAFAALVAPAAPRHAAALGLAFGTAWVGAGTWWLYISMHRYGGLPAWMTVLAVAALSAFLSLYLAATLALFSRWRSGRAGVAALQFGAAWLLAELARGVIFTGFPWAASGYAQVDSPLARLAPWIGVYGIGFVVASASAWAGFTLRRPQRRWSAPVAGIAAVALLAITPVPTFTRPTGTLTVTLLQGNVPQEEKFASEHQGAALEWHVGALLAARTDLVVAPETAIPFLPQQMPEDFWPSLRARFQGGGTYALFGVPLGDEKTGYTNSAVGFAPRRAAEYRYDKHHLVPFGEFIPAGFKWFTRMMNIPLGDFNRGTLDQPSFAVRGERIAPNICYEDLFGEELAARFGDAAGAPTMFANLSNIGWFGNSIAIPQHLHISRLRALEFERPMLRATNTGATVVIDHRGVVTHRLAPHTRGVLEASVQGRSGTTPFAWWSSRVGLWPLWIGGALLLAAGARGRVDAARN
jgi:apolipoprotein N-acyltransferase